MKQYLEVLRHIMENGVNLEEDRTGHGRKRVFGIQKRFDISNGKFPLVTTRYINAENAIFETLMFIFGFTDINYLKDNGVNIWNKWAATEETADRFLKRQIKNGRCTEEQAYLAKLQYDTSIYGQIGPMYGYLWRFFPIVGQDIHYDSVIRTVDDLPSDQVARLTDMWNSMPDDQKESLPLEQWLITHYYSAIDQLNELVQNLKNDPFSSRHLVTAYHPAFNPIPGYEPDENVIAGRGCLMPCHHSFQVFVNPPACDGGKNRLSLKFTMRSNDVPVGAPTNIAGYALLAHLLAKVTDMDTDELIWDATDAHVYLDQREGAEEQLGREPLPMPTIWINPELKDLFAVTRDDIRIENYEHHPKIVYPVAV